MKECLERRADTHTMAGGYSCQPQLVARQHSLLSQGCPACLALLVHPAGPEGRRLRLTLHHKVRPQS